MSTGPLRVVLYSHDSQGLGHLRRNLAIAHNLARGIPQLTGREVVGLIISGLAPTMRFPLPPGFDWVTIPGIAKGAHGYEPRALGDDTGALIALRSSLLEASLIGFAPDLVIVDRHIYGVWQELRGPLRQLRKVFPQSRVVLGLREVLDTPQVAAAEWERLGNPDTLRTLVDEVWVYGDPTIHDPLLTGEAPPALCDRIRFTGYLAHGRRVTDSVASSLPSPYILTTAGGGSDGRGILRAAVEMVPPPGYQHVLVTGPQLDDVEFDEIQAKASPHTHVYRSLPGLGGYLADAAAVIAMGGYNTVAEILATTTPALIVPREVPRREQLIRAEALAKVGAVDYIRAADVTGPQLTEWVTAAVARRVDRSVVDGHGLRAVSRLAVDLCHLADSPAPFAASRELVGGTR